MTTTPTRDSVRVVSNSSSDSVRSNPSLNWWRRFNSGTQIFFAFRFGEKLRFTVFVAADDSEATYSAEIVRDEEVVASQRATIEL